MVLLCFMLGSLGCSVFFWFWAALPKWFQNQKNQNNPKSPAGSIAKSTRKPKKKPKKTRIWANYGDVRGMFTLIVCPDPWFFWFFLVFSMVLASSQLASLVFFGFSGFLDGFDIRSSNTSTAGVLALENAWQGKVYLLSRGQRKVMNKSQMKASISGQACCLPQAFW